MYQEFTSGNRLKAELRTLLVVSPPPSCDGQDALCTTLAQASKQLRGTGSAAASVEAEGWPQRPAGLEQESSQPCTKGLHK